MKSILALTVVMLATASAKPMMAPLANQCHLFDPSNPNPAFYYLQCDLTCILANPKNVLCSFDVSKEAHTASVGSKMEIETNRTSTEATDTYVCVSNSAIQLADLPLANRAQCVKCTITDHVSNGEITASVKCDGMSGFAYTSQSMFAVESYLKDQSPMPSNFRDGGVWSVPGMEPESSQLDRVEVDILYNNQGVSYKINTWFQ